MKDIVYFYLFALIKWCHIFF